MSEIKLFEDKLPNKIYNTATKDMVDFKNETTERGIGWSAIDIGRLLIPFQIIVWNFHNHANEVKNVLKRWDFNDLLSNGQMFGAMVDEDGNTVLVQEGRIGYEEYAAKAYSMIGFDVGKALKYNDFLAFVDVFGIRVPFDNRTPELFNDHNYVVSESYILDGIEFGWDTVSRELAYRVYRAQEERFNQTDILTAVSEDNIDRPPYFVYNTVFTDGKLFTCITEDGKDASALKTISTKAVFGWHVLYQTPYTERLMEAVTDLNNPNRGWFSGYYEIFREPNRALTCNTNAIILEGICFKKFGKLIGIYNENYDSRIALNTIGRIVAENVH